MVEFLRILKRARRHGAEDQFMRLSTLMAALWTANAISFVFLHGDAESALRAFALPAGIMLACDWHLQRRFAPRGTVAAAPAKPSSDASPEPPAPFLEPAGV